MGQESGLNRNWTTKEDRNWTTKDDHGQQQDGGVEPTTLEEGGGHFWAPDYQKRMDQSSEAVPSLQPAVRPSKREGF